MSKLAASCLLTAAILLIVLGIRVLQPAAQKTAPPQEDMIQALPQSEYYHLYRLTLEDGTRCLLTYNNGGPNGISCQWQTK